MKENFHLNGSIHEDRMTQPTQLWLWPNLLSLDAPLVALLWQVLFVRCFHGRLHGAEAVLLALVVWLIYAGDRMLDALKGAVQTRRHAFYRKHWRLVCIMWAAGLAIGGWLAWAELPASLWFRGIGLAGLVGIYLAIVHGIPRLLRSGAKEAAVGIVFAAGVSLVSWPMVRTPADLLTIVLFCVLCWMNCVGIEDWESGERVRGSVIFAAAGVAVTATLLLREQRPVLACAETASALGLVVLDRISQRISPEAARVLADTVLLTPILFLGVAGKIT